MNVENQTRELLPKQQSIHSSKYNVLKVVEADVYSEISWKNGLFSFKSKSLKEIMTVLSRWYDIDVIFEIKEPEKIMFNGVLKKNLSLEQMLEIINRTNLINAYEIENNTITIK